MGVLCSSARPALLPQVAKYATVLAPRKDAYVPLTASNCLERVDRSFVENAHAAGLQVHPFTFRNEDR
jgi:glycerophosphoryl diester phosphodiesterase